MNIVAGRATDVLTTMGDGSAAAVVSLVSQCKKKDVRAVAAELIRVSRGPVALLTSRGARTWSRAFARLGWRVTEQTYDDALDVVLASRSRPVRLPPADVGIARPLIGALIETVSNVGDVVLDPFAATSLVPLTIVGADRRLTAIAPTTFAKRSLVAAFRGGTTVRLTEEEKQKVLDLTASGMSRADTARALDVRYTHVNNLIITRRRMAEKRRAR